MVLQIHQQIQIGKQTSKTVSLFFLYGSVIFILASLIFLLQFFIGSRNGKTLYLSGVMAAVSIGFGGIPNLFSSGNNYFVGFYLLNLYYFVLLIGVIIISSVGSLLPATDDITYHKSTNTETHNTNFRVSNATNINNPPEGNYIGFGVYNENTSSFLCVSSADSDPNFNFLTQSSFQTTLDPKPLFQLQFGKATPAIVVIDNDDDDKNIQWESKSTPYGGFSGRRYENQKLIPLLKDGLHFFILSQTTNSMLEQDNYGFCMMMNGKIPFHWSRYPNLQFLNKSIALDTKDPIYKATVWTMSCSKK